MSEEPTLFDRLGGSAGIEAVVDEFYERVLADERLAAYFDDVRMDELRDHQRAFVATVAGGPDTYEGRTMREAHARLDLTDAEFDAVAGHLEGALRALDVPASDRDAVLTAVEGFREDVVGRPEA